MQRKVFFIFLMIVVINGYGFPVKFVYEDATAREVYVAGDFNGWDQTRNPLEKKDGNRWETVIDLEPGKYEYKFIVDGVWTNDPTNPVKVGTYGNNAIEVTADGKVTYPLPGNLVGSPAVNVGGDFQFYLYYLRSPNGNWAMERPYIEFRPSLSIDLGRGGILRTRLLFSTKEEDVYHNIFMRIRDASYHFSRAGFSFTGFYDKRLFRFEEPFYRLGYEGEFFDLFGWYEAGISLEFKRGNSFSWRLIFSDNFNTDRDLLATRLETKYAGLTYITENFFDKEYSRAAPFSTSSDTLYNTSHSRFYLSLDGRAPLGVFFGILHSDENLVASEIKVGQSNWQRIKKSWFVRKKDWFCLGIKRELPFSFTGNLRLDFEEASFKDPYPHGFWFFISQMHRIRVSTVSLFFEHSSRLEDSKVGFKRSVFDFGDTAYVKWDDLFYLEPYKNLTLPKYFLIGYGQNLILEHVTNFKFLNHFNLVWQNNISSFRVITKPVFFSSEIQASYKVGAFEFAVDLMGAFVNDDYLDIKANYMFKHFKASYMFGNGGKLAIGWGLDPYDIERDRRSWRQFLNDNGVSVSVARSNYIRLSRIIPSAFSALEKYKGVYLKGEVVF